MSHFVQSLLQFYMGNLIKNFCTKHYRVRNYWVSGIPEHPKTLLETHCFTRVSDGAPCKNKDLDSVSMRGIFLRVGFRKETKYFFVIPHPNIRFSLTLLQINAFRSKPDPHLVKQLNENHANRYSFVCNALLNIGNCQSPERLNEVCITIIPD